MRIIHLSNEVVGERLGHTLFDRAGRVMLNAGVELTGRYVELLLEHGYRSIPVHDPLAPEAVPVDVLQRETRSAVHACVQRCFDQGTKPVAILVPVVERVINHILADLTDNPDLAYNVSALRSLDEGLFVHSINVCVYALILAASLALDRADLLKLGVGALLHDIGKIYYMDLVNKPGKLTPEEFTTIQRHTVDGYELLRRQPGIHLFAAHVAYQHHERLDGSGYPRGLTADRIHLWAQLVAVADIYETVTSDRPYGLGVRPHAAMVEISRMAEAGKLERRFVRHLSQRLAAYPEGSILLLATGEVAVVVGQTAISAEKPRVHVLTDAGLHLTPPVGRVLDGSGPGTTIRSVLEDYPTRVKEQVRAAAAVTA